ncbi:MAG TPA: hypothetical protein VLW55_27620 [Burkholderiaceae bacterium]|nr:hypothetical protein [Burkholderiaceae bacterium]
MNGFVGAGNSRRLTSRAVQQPLVRAVLSSSPQAQKWSLREEGVPGDACALLCIGHSPVEPPAQWHLVTFVSGDSTARIWHTTADDTLAK